MITLKCGQALSSHITSQNRWTATPQVYEDEAIEDAGEVAVHIETHQPTAELGVMLQKDGHSFAVTFHVRNGIGKVLQIDEVVAGRISAGRIQRPRPKWGARHDPVAQHIALHGREALLLSLEEAHNQFPRRTIIAAANTNGPEQNGIFGIRSKKPPNALPDHEQRRILPLIFQPDERPAQLN